MKLSLNPNYIKVMFYFSQIICIIFLCTNFLISIMTMLNQVLVYALRYCVTKSSYKPHFNVFLHIFNKYTINRIQYEIFQAKYGLVPRFNRLSHWSQVQWYWRFISILVDQCQFLAIVSFSETNCLYSLS